MKKIIMVSLLLIAFCWSFSGWGQEVQDVIDSINAQNNQEQFEEQDSEQIIHILLAAEAEGLPMRPLLNKVREGLAKRAERWRIYDVLVRKKEFLKQAKSIVDDAGNCGLYVGSEERDVDDLAKLLESRDIDEGLLRQTFTLPECAGVEFRTMMEICSRLGDGVVLDEEVKKEIIELALGNKLDESSVVVIADELEDANLRGADVGAALVKIRRRYK